MTHLQRRDPEALHHLFDRYAHLVFAVAICVLRDRGEAEEIVQDTFFYVHQKAVLFDASKGTAKGWITQIAYHKALDRRSYLGRRGSYVGTEIGSLDDSLIGATDLDREIGSRLNRVQLEKAFDELPELQRRTLELFYFEALDLWEVSEKLNHSLENIRHYYYRGLKNLRKSVFVRKLREK